MKKERTKTFTVRLWESQMNLIRNEAGAQQRTISNLLAVLIEGYFTSKDKYKIITEKLNEHQLQYSPDGHFHVGNQRH